MNGLRPIDMTLEEIAHDAAIKRENVNEEARIRAAIINANRQGAKAIGGFSK